MKIQIEIPDTETSALSAILKQTFTSLVFFDDNNEEIPRADAEIIEDAIYNFLEEHLYIFRERKEQKRLDALKQPVERIALKKERDKLKGGTL